MRSPEEVAREALRNITGPMRCIFSDPAHAYLLDVLDVLVAQEVEEIATLIRERDVEAAETTRAKALRGAADEVDRMLTSPQDERCNPPRPCGVGCSCPTSPTTVKESPATRPSLSGTRNGGCETRA